MARCRYFYNPSVNPAATLDQYHGHLNPTVAYSPYVTGKLATYMLVNTPFDLQNVRNNTRASYALGKRYRQRQQCSPELRPDPEFHGRVRRAERERVR